jgi:hypothetical protein
MISFSSIPPHSAEVFQRLLRGYQFSRSDRDIEEIAELYHSVDENFEWFQWSMSAAGLRLVRDEYVILLEYEQKELTSDEKQTMVAVFLLGDLWFEHGGIYRDLFSMPIRWLDLGWMRDGYGRDYLLQVGVKDIDDLEDVWRRAERKGILHYNRDTSTLTLREPAARIFNLAQAIHRREQTKLERHHE